MFDAGDTYLGLRLLDGTLMDRTPGYDSASSFMQTTATQCFRFLNSESFFTPKEFNLLLMAIQKNSTKKRRGFYELVRSCRRRKQRPVEMLPVNRLFTTADEYHLLEYRSTLSRIRREIHSHGMYIQDAFARMDVNKDTLLSCSELYSGLLWLHVKVTPGDIHRLVTYMDSNNDGMLSFRELKGALIRSGVMSQNEADDVALSNSTEEQEELAEKIEIIEIKELYEKEEKEEKKIDPVPLEYLKKMEIKIKKHSDFDEVWTSQGIASRKKVSIWAPELDAYSMFTQLVRKPKEFVCLGHYVNGSFKKPSRPKPLMLQIKDKGALAAFGMDSTHEMIDRFKAQYLPHPLRFHEVWNETRGKKPIHAWEPVPPKGFVALGMVCTTSEDAPKKESMRCVPKSWVKETKAKPKLIWNDAGTGGAKGSFWVINEMQMLSVVQGHTAPKSTFYDFPKRVFMASDYAL
eukprot:g6960.t1